MGWRGSLEQNCAGKEKARGEVGKKMRKQKRIENKEERKIGKGRKGGKEERKKVKGGKVKREGEKGEN